MRGCDGVRGGRVGGPDGGGGGGAAGGWVGGGGGGGGSRVCWGEFVPAEVGGSASDGCDEVAAGTLVACVSRMAAVKMKGRMADAARPQVRWDRNRAEAPCSSGRGDAGVRVRRSDTQCTGVAGPGSSKLRQTCSNVCRCAADCGT